MVDEESFKNIFSQFFPQGGEYTFSVRRSVFSVQEEVLCPVTLAHSSRAVRVAICTL
jgi:hypothetical protein